MTPAQRVLIEHIKQYGHAWRTADGHWRSGPRQFNASTIRPLLDYGALEVVRWRGSGNHQYPVEVGLRAAV